MDARAALSELRERVAAANEQRQPLQLRGAGTKDFYAQDPAAIAGAARDRNARPMQAQRSPLEPQVLDLRAYRGIVDYEPSELVITARCGTRLSEIESALADRGQFLAFEPPAFNGDPTIGGVIAAGLSGPRRMYAGAARDFVLGATLLNAQGDILRFGGQVMKNVAGFDVSRLLCGSLGILGVIAEVSLKVLPRPRAEETLRFEMSARQAVEAFNHWSGQPLPLSGAAWCDGIAWIRLSGASSAVTAARDRLGGERVDPTAAMQWWNALRHCQHAIFQSSTLWRLSVPDTTPPLPLPGSPLIDWGGALRWYAREPPNERDDSGVPEGTAVAEIRSIVSANGGTALCWRGAAPASGRFHPLQPAIARLTRQLKERFDPHGIFNPGRMVPGL
jgi:glycolate oxidase FAD binding subunit